MSTWKKMLEQVLKPEPPKPRLYVGINPRTGERLGIVYKCSQCNRTVSASAACCNQAPPTLPASQVERLLLPELYCNDTAAARIVSTWQESDSETEYERSDPGGV